MFKKNNLKCNFRKYAWHFTLSIWILQGCVIHAIWSYNERWDFPRAGSSLFLPRFSGLTFLRFLGPFFIFSEIFASGVLYFLRWFFIFFQLLNEMKGTYMNNKKKSGCFRPICFFWFQHFLEKAKVEIRNLFRFKSFKVGKKI